jgi:hypothetical protein
MQRVAEIRIVASIRNRHKCVLTYTTLRSNIPMGPTASRKITNASTARTKSSIMCWERQTYLASRCPRNIMAVLTTVARVNKVMPIANITRVLRVWALLVPRLFTRTHAVMQNRVKNTPARGHWTLSKVE